VLASSKGLWRRCYGEQQTGQMPDFVSGELAFWRSKISRLIRGRVQKFAPHSCINAGSLTYCS
jgi:hypothetical protein